MMVVHPERALYLPQSPVVVSGGEAFGGDVLVNAAPDSRLSPPTTKDSGRRQPPADRRGSSPRPECEACGSQIAASGSLRGNCPP